MTTALVTGANRGIGLELARQLRQRGDHVIAVCRKSSPALAALELRVESGIDVSEPRSIDRLRDRLDTLRLDILINNAGVLGHESLGSLDFEAIRRQWEVNAIGPLRVTEALLPLLAEGAKIALITSQMGSIADNRSGGAYGYRMSKAALNAAGVSLARDLAPRKIAIAILHPGFVRTDMTGKNGLIDASQSAAGLIARIDELTLETSGSFLRYNGEALPW